MKTIGSIQLNITVFTAALFKNYPQPSQDPAAPTPAPAEYLYVVQTGGGPPPLRAAAAGESLHLTLQNRETHVLINVYSESGNFDNPVLFYELYEPTGKNLLQLQSLLLLYPDTLTRVPGSFNPLETAEVEKDFWLCLSRIRQRGTATYGIRTLVYDDDLEPYGYFEFPVTLEVA